MLVTKRSKIGCKKTIVDDDYVTFPYKVKVDICIGSCNNITNPYSKVYVRDAVKNICVKGFDLISQQNKFREVQFHESCKCDCLLNKCRRECLKIEKCDNNSFWNVVNCKREHKKAAKLITEEECEEI